MKTRYLALFPFAVLCASSPVHALDYFWDTDLGTGSNLNGNGTWETVTANWTNPVGGANTNWNNDGTGSAFLGNIEGAGYSNPTIGGTITLGENINLFALSMSSGQSGSYIIEGGGYKLTLIGANAYVGNNNTSATLTINAVVDGTSGLLKSNSGTVILGAANIYTGNTKIGAGQLRVGDANAIPSGTGKGNVVLDGGTSAGILDLNGFDVSINGLSGVTGTVLGRVVNNSTGTNKTLTIGNNNATASFAGIIANNTSGTGTLAIVKTGTGTQTLTGANTYTGTTTIGGGVLDVGTLDGVGDSLGSGGLLFSSGVLQGNGTFSRIASGVVGAGTGQISGLTGGFSAKGGQLNVDLGASFALSVGGYRFGSNFILGSSSADSLVKVTSNLDFGGSNRTVTVNSGTGGDAAEFSGIVSGVGWGFNKAGTGLLILSGNNTNTGVTTINAGTVRAAHNNAFGISAATVALGSTGATLELANAININRALTVSDTGDKKTLRLQSGAATGNYSGTVLINETGATNFDLSAAVGQTLTVSGKVSGTGAAGINKVGAGTVVLTAANDYTGVTTISAGILDVGAIGSGALGGGGLRMVNNSVLQGNGSFIRPFSNSAVAAAGEISGGSGGFAARGGILTVNFGNSGSTVFLSGASFSNRLGDNFVFGSADSNNVVVVVNGLNLNGSNRTFTVNSGAGGDSAELQGVIAASAVVGINKLGAGHLTLSAANTYTGTTNIDAGTLAINGTQSAATGNVNVSNAGTRLIGTGTVGGSTTINAGAIHSAGGAVANLNKVEQQAFGQNLTYAGESIFEWDLNSNKDTDGLDDNAGLTTDNGARGVDFDAVDVTGNLTVSAAAIFKVIVGSGVNFASEDGFWARNQQWSNIFNVTGTGGTLGWSNTAVAVYNTSNELQTVGSYGGFTITGTTLSWTAVPEPTSALAGLLVAGGLLRRRRGI